jgi:hypothetical protein
LPRTSEELSSDELATNFRLILRYNCDAQRVLATFELKSGMVCVVAGPELSSGDPKYGCFSSGQEKLHAWMVREKLPGHSQKFTHHQRPIVSLVLLYTPSEDFAADIMSHCSLLMVACALMLVSSRAVGASPDFESRWMDSKRDFDLDMKAPPPPPPPDCSSNPCVHGSCAKPQGDTCDGGPSYVQQYVCAPPGSLSMCTVSITHIRQDIH